MRWIIITTITLILLSFKINFTKANGQMYKADGKNKYYIEFDENVNEKEEIV